MTTRPPQQANSHDKPSNLQSAVDLGNKSPLLKTDTKLSKPSTDSLNTQRNALQPSFISNDPMTKSTSHKMLFSETIPILSPPSSSSGQLSPRSPSSPTSPYSRSRSPTRSGQSFSPQTLVVDAQDVQFLRKSATSHFRNLALNVESSKDAHLHLPGVTEDREDVTGMSGRLRLQKTEDSKSHLASRNWMDNQRKYLQAYEYLCHIGEAKEWIEECIDEEIPSVIQLEEALRNGVILAKLTRQFAPELVKKLIEAPKLQFRHTDNINYFFKFLDKVGMPSVRIIAFSFVFILHHWQHFLILWFSYSPLSSQIYTIKRISQKSFTAFMLWVISCPMKALLLQ